MIEKHTIHSLVFEIEGFENNSHFQTIASKISSIVRISLKPMLDKLLKEYNVEGYHVVIESLEIDLQFINSNNLSNNLTRLLRLELNKRFRRIHSKVTYDIKHGKATTKNYIKTKSQTLGDVISKKQITTAYELNKDPSHYFQTMTHQKVVPEDARYFDAVIHYLEYGWLPRYLDIPMLEFDEIFVTTLSTYGEEINQYFERKPINKQSKITERILRQTAKNSYLKSNKKATKTISQVFLGKTSPNQIQAFVKFLDHIKTGSQSFTENQKEEIRKIAKDISVNTELISKITGIDSSSFNPFVELDKRIDAMLDVHDRAFFNSLLETNFYKSLVQSYVAKTDSHAVLVRTLIPSLLEPFRSNEIFSLAPELIDSENELINQLYGKSPVLLNEIFTNLSRFTSSPKALTERITHFVNKLSKKQTNKIFQSIFSYYNSLTVQLNEISRYIEKTSYIDLFEYVTNSITNSTVTNAPLPKQTNTFAHVQLLSLISFSNLPPNKVLKLYLEKTLEFLIKEKVITQNEKIRALNLNNKISNRSFSRKELEERIVMLSLIQEQEILKTQSKEVELYRLKTLLQDFYLPRSLAQVDNDSYSLEKRTKEDELSLIKSVFQELYLPANLQKVKDSLPTLQKTIKQNITNKEISSEIQAFFKDLLLTSNLAQVKSNLSNLEKEILKVQRNQEDLVQLKSILQSLYLPTNLTEIKEVLEPHNKTEGDKKLDADEELKRKQGIMSDKGKAIDDDKVVADEELKRKQGIMSDKGKAIDDNKVVSKEELKLKQGIVPLLKKLKEYNVSKKEIQEIFTNKRILKNPVLSKLKPETFKDILELALTTDRARQYFKLFEKYKDIFRIHVNNEQVQLIFLSLINAQKELSEDNIFKLYYEELKKLKGWTYEVHKKRLITMYENKVENFTKDEKDQLIKYIDEIPTYTGLELRDTKKKLEEGIPIKNAGLCLLWPFFKTLFTISGYLDAKGEFKTVEMRERATLLLQYLAVKSAVIEEPYLALNKIFTGLPLEEPIPKEIVLTEKEKDIADALLLNVIKQWPSFDNSSPDNLRGSFIIRDGVLFFRGKEWILRVENKAYDLLLSKLPWGYSMIRLSWVPYMIKVEWN